MYHREISKFISSKYREERGSRDSKWKKIIWSCILCDPRCKILKIWFPRIFNGKRFFFSEIFKIYCAERILEKRLFNFINWQWIFEFQGKTLIIRTEQWQITVRNIRVDHVFVSHPRNFQFTVQRLNFQPNQKPTN